MHDITIPYSLKTWADGFGVWHCEITVATVTRPSDMLGRARAAIAEEIRQRGNADTAAFLDSAGFQVEYIGNNLTTQGLRYEFREAAPLDIPAEVARTSKPTPLTDYPTIGEVIDHLVIGHDGEYNWTMNVARFNAGDEIDIRPELAEELLKLKADRSQRQHVASGEPPEDLPLDHPLRNQS